MSTPTFDPSDKNFKSNFAELASSISRDDDYRQATRFSNYRELPPQKESDKPTRVPREMSEIITDFRELQDELASETASGLILKIGDQMFYDARHLPWNSRSRLYVIDAPAALFGHVAEFRKIMWTEGTNFLTKAEFYRKVASSIASYEACYMAPHFPPVRNAYYLHAPVAPKSGVLLEQLLDRCLPHAKDDRIAMKALVLSLFSPNYWGARPIFVLTSPGGQGSGKSKSIMHIATELLGSYTVFTGDFGADEASKRLLSAEGRRSRVLIFDNVTQGTDFGALATFTQSPIISGRQLYAGEGWRLNDLVYCVTQNVPTLDTDIADRAMTIRIDPPGEDADNYWDTKFPGWIRENREGLLAEIAHELIVRQPLKFEKAVPFRNKEWFVETVGRCCESVDEALEIATNQRAICGSHDHERQNVEEFRATIYDRLKENGFDPDSEIIFLPNEVLQRLVHKVVRKVTDTTVRQFQSHKYFPELQATGTTFRPYTKNVDRQRGLAWVPKGKKWDQNAAKIFDVKIPIEFEF